MTKHKLFVFCPRLGGGGAEKQALRLLNSLDQSRYFLTLIVIDDSGSYMSSLHPGIRVLKLSGLKTKSSTLGLIGSLFSLGKTLKREKPDTVISFLGNAGVVVALALRFYGLSGNLNFIFRVQTTPLNALRHNPSIINRLFYSLFPLAYNAANTIVTVSEGVKSEIVARNSKWEKKTKTIYNIIPHQDSQDSRNKDPDRPLLMSVCGRLIKLKSFEMAIQVVANLRNMGVSVELDVIGSGPELDSLNQLVQELKISESVRFHGYLDHPSEVISQSDIFLLTSKYEGFPNVIIEAMALGVPVISTNCPYGPSEIIKDGWNGFLIPVGDIEAMTKKTKELLESDEILEVFSRNARETVKSFHSNEIISHYEQVINPN